MKKRGQLWISAVIYVLVIVAVIVIVIEALTPVIEDMKDKAIFNRARDSFLIINDYIKSVGSEGQGSQRTVPIEVQKGSLYVEDNGIKWKLDTDASILEHRTQVEMGNLIVVANGDVDAYETANETFVLKNSKSLFEFHKFGSMDQFQNSTNSSGTIIDFTGETIVKRAAFIKSETEHNVTPSYAFFVPPDTSTSVVNGYTILLREGSDLGKAQVIAHINSTNYEYDIVFTLESHADYLQVELVEEFV